MIDEKEDSDFYETPLRKVQKGGLSRSEAVKEKLLKDSEISIILDDYDDIFSDFDPRPYPNRALSDDFLPEIKRASRDKPTGGVELRLLIPAERRDATSEALIKRRLKDHFRHHHELLIGDARKIRWLGLVMIFIGAVLGVFATWLYTLENTSFFFKFILILMEPASWFSIWEGINRIFFGASELNGEQAFYKKMMGSEIEFISY